ncbi:spore coat putative kinase YutH [Niallia sp. Krafla_26]|uniref:spore coat putative kinase YutH n=1 Tax=Niallia sp. Krafla_26 TaxID=3064703 RepID=UPI003D1755C4
MKSVRNILPTFLPSYQEFNLRKGMVMMFQKLLKRHYGIDAIESTPFGRYQTCAKDHQRFCLIPLGKKEDEEIIELEHITNHLKRMGDRSVSTFVYTKEKKRMLETESGNYCVITWDETQKRTVTKLGRKLAKFHYRGRSLSIPVKKITRIGQWKSLWEKRIDQMEKVWIGMMQHEPANEFDRMFFESFPYYMAMAENAIQYLVDTELDDDPQAIDYGTVCHIRFTSHTWGEGNITKNPFDWVLDHCSRDLAEWTRERYFNHYRTYEPEVLRFFEDYQSVQPLSSFSWRLLYARILFPLHYVECIENYYSTQSEQERLILTERLEQYLKSSKDHEQFLGHFFQMARVPVRQQHIPIIDWL